MTIVYFGTNRNPIEKDGAVVDFGSKFSPDGVENLRFGQAVVQDGKIIDLQVAPDTTDEGSTAMFSHVQQKMANEGTDTLVMIHGYATSFVQSILGAAHAKGTFAEADLNVFMFSWPSDGKNVPPQAYKDDRQDAEHSGLAFMRGFMKLLDFFDSGVMCGRHVHLLAHSMGNYVTRFFLQAAIKQFSGQPLPRIFENIFSMAADEDADALDCPDKWQRLPELTRHLHIYFNNHDHALNFSTATKNNPDRMGSDGPTQPLNIHSKVTLVDVSRTEDWFKAATSLGHGYYDEQPKVIADILQVLAGRMPDQVNNRNWIPAKNRYFIIP